MFGWRLHEQVVKADQVETAPKQSAQDLDQDHLPVLFYPNAPQERQYRDQGQKTDRDDAVSPFIRKQAHLPLYKHIGSRVDDCGHADHRGGEIERIHHIHTEEWCCNVDAEIPHGNIDRKSDEVRMRFQGG